MERERKNEKQKERCERGGEWVLISAVSV